MHKERRGEKERHVRVECIELDPNEGFDVG